MGAERLDLGGHKAPRPASIISIKQHHGTRELFEGESDLMTVKRLHEITGMDERVIREQINDGSLPGCKIGRRLFVPKPQLIEYVTQRGGL